MPFAYDEIPYTNQSYPEMSPAQMAVLGQLFGLDPPHVAHCRVLEIGCGNGMNLLPLALAFPESHFEGIDLSGVAIQEGQNMVQALGLKNLVLHHTDLTRWPLEGPTYDFMMAHGVYSWVPAEVRTSLLKLYKSRLSPNGMGYISFKAYPGAHFYAASRHMMRYHTREITDANTQIGQSMAMLRFVLSGQPESPAVLHHRFYKDYLQTELERLSELPDWYLQHDHLADFSEPFYFFQAQEHFLQQGLQYWADAHFPAMQIRNFPKPVQQMLAKMPFLEREQYLDFLLGRAFRQALVCHAGVQRLPISKPEALLSCLVGAPFQIEEAASDQFALTGHNGIRIQSNNGAVRTIASFLGQKWPNLVPVSEVVMALRNTLSIHPDQQSPFILRILLGLYADDLLILRTVAPNLAKNLSEYPVAIKIARFQASYGLSFLTNGFHEAKPISDPATLFLIPLLDGTRERTTLLADWQHALKEHLETDVNKTTLESTLMDLWQNGFLEA